MRPALLPLTIALAASVAYSQATKPRFDKAVSSPEVRADRTVTFRFFAPNAKSVALEREGAKRTTLTKDESGVWSLTTDPLDPDYYVYSFIVDKQQLADPANPLQHTIITGGSESILHVPGSPDLPWEENNVPHGTLHKQFFHSTVLSEDRYYWVYTPPNYNPRNAYPVLYLLHGVMDDGTAWLSPGQANTILDNLIARKQSKSMILVIPLGYGFADPADHVDDLFSFATDQKKIMDTFETDLFDEITPDLARNYRIDKRRQAIAGVSMGGAEALYFGLNNPNCFTAIGAFSPAVIMYSSYDRFFPNIGNVKLLDIDCGTDDFLYKPVQGFRDWLTKKGLNFTAIDTPGDHNWLVWRRNLIDFAPKLFR